MKFYANYHFMMILISQEKKGNLKGMPKINNIKNLRDSLVISKPAKKDLFSNLLRD